MYLANNNSCFKQLSPVTPKGNTEDILRTVLQTALTDLRRKHKGPKKKKPEGENQRSDAEDESDTDVEEEREGNLSSSFLPPSFPPSLPASLPAFHQPLPILY